MHQASRCMHQASQCMHQASQRMYQAGAMHAGALGKLEHGLMLLVTPHADRAPAHQMGLLCMLRAGPTVHGPKMCLVWCMVEARCTVRLFTALSSACIALLWFQLTSCGLAIALMLHVHRLHKYNMYDFRLSVAAASVCMLMLWSYMQWANWNHHWLTA